MGPLPHQATAAYADDEQKIPGQIANMVRRVWAGKKAVHQLR